MRKKEPYEEEYGRHASFRAGRDYGSAGPHLGKWMLALFLVVFAVLGVERWRKRSPAPIPVASAQPLRVPASSAPIAEAPALSEQEAVEPEPMELAKQIPPAIAVPVRAQAREPTPPPDVVNKPETEVRYEMKMNRGNSFVGQGAINGKDVTLLADTGASTVVVPERLAQRLGLKRGGAIPFHTGGGIVIHYATTLDTLTMGRIEITKVPAAINPAMNEDFILLGMSALKLMDIEYGEGTLVLKHRQMIVSKEMRTVGEENFKRSVKDCTREGNKIDRQTLECLRGR